MKRILMLLEREYPPDVRVDKEAVTLMNLGFEVHVLSFNFGKKNAYELHQRGIHVHRLKIHREVFRKGGAIMNTIPYYQHIWKKNINKLFEQFSFDAIHVHDLPVCGLALGFANKYKIPLIADMHENYPYMILEMQEFQPWLIRRFVNMGRWISNEKKWLEGSTEVIATCQEMKQRHVKLGINPDKIHVIENTVELDEDLSGDHVSDPGFITLLYLGGVTQNRGLNIVLDGYERIKRNVPKARLWIVGDGRFKKVLQNKIHINHIQDVTFWGWKSRTEAKDLMIKSDICLIPHIKSVHTDNTSPNKIFEYFNAGKPVIVSNCNYIERIVMETSAGISYQWDSAEDFERAFFELIKNDLNVLSKNARNAVRMKYNWNHTQKSLIELYLKLFA